MRILVCGSSELDPAHHDVARMVGRTLIAETAHTILQGGLEAHPPNLSCDQLVAAGIRSALQRRGEREEDRVMTVLPGKDEWKRFHLGESWIIPGADSRARRRVMVGRADLVISLAGTHATPDILEHAYELQKLVLPLAFTGQASQRVWSAHKAGTIRDLRLTGSEIAFIETGAEPRDRHLLQVLRRSGETQKKHIRLLVVSPNDVPDERDAVVDVASELNAGIAHVLNRTIDVGRWETDTYPGFHVEGPQGLVDALLKIDDSDLIIGIFGARLGSGGTVHEIDTALAAWRSTGRPHVMVYFRDGSEMPADLREFRDGLAKAGGLMGSFTTAADFERKVRRDVTAFLRTRFHP